MALQVIDVHDALPDGLAIERLFDAYGFDQRSLAAVLALRRSLDGARELGWITPAQADAWRTGRETLDRDGKFFGALSGVMGAATVQ